MLRVKRGDTHDIVLTAAGLDGKPVDLTGADVRVHAKLRRSGSEPILLDSAVIEPVSEGRVRHRLTGTLEPGEYAVEIELTRNNVITTAPTHGTITLVVEPDIA